MRFSVKFLVATSWTASVVLSVKGKECERERERESEREENDK